MKASSQIRWQGLAPAAQHGLDEGVIVGGLADEAAALRVDGDDAGLAPVEHEMREHGRAAVAPFAHRDRGPEGIVGVIGAEVSAGLRGQSKAVAGRALGHRRMRAEPRQQTSPQLGIARESARRQHHAATAPDDCGAGAGLQPGAGDAPVVLDEFDHLRRRQNRHAAPLERVEKASRQRIAHDQPGAALVPQPVGAMPHQHAGGVTERAERARRAEQVPDVGAIHHHAAEDGELGQRRAEGGEVASQHARIERHRLQHAARRGRAADAGRIVGVVRIGPEADLAVGLQEVDHARRVVQERVGHLGSQAIADRALQIAQSLLAGVGGFVVAGIGDPYGTRRARRGAADGFGLFDQQQRRGPGWRR